MSHKSRKFMIVNIMIHVKGTCSWVPRKAHPAPWQRLPGLRQWWTGKGWLFAATAARWHHRGSFTKIPFTINASTGISQVWAIASRVFIHSSVIISLPLICATLWGLHRVGWSSSSLLGTYWAQFSWNVLCHWGGLTFTTSCSVFTHFFPHVFPHYIKA